MEPLSREMGRLAPDILVVARKCATHLVDGMFGSPVLA